MDVKALLIAIQEAEELTNLMAMFTAAPRKGRSGYGQNFDSSCSSMDSDQGKLKFMWIGEKL